MFLSLDEGSSEKKKNECNESATAKQRVSLLRVT